MSSRTDQQVGENVATPARSRTDSVDITAAPRAVLRESVRLLYRVIGEERLGTARGNAWAAVCADRERARERAEVNRLLSRSRAERVRQLDSRQSDISQASARQGDIRQASARQDGVRKASVRQGKATAG
ncbi:MAG TPA: hypothetical protein VF163_01965 [Micromonosporaceae bacterium]